MRSYQLTPAEQAALAAGRSSWPLRRVVANERWATQLPYDLPRLSVVETLECGHEGARYTIPGRSGAALRRRCYRCAVEALE